MTTEANRIAQLEVARTADQQKHPEYVPADDPDAGLAALRNAWNLPPWVVNPRPRVQIEPYIPTGYVPAGGASEF